MSDAQRAEATGTTVDVKFGDHIYKIDPTDMTWDAVGAENLTVVSTLLGPKQFELFKARNPKPLIRDDDGDVVSVVDLFSVKLLDTLGKSAASTGS